MQDVKPGTTLLASGDDPTSRIASDAVDSALSSQTHSTRATLIKDASTPAMRQDENFANLWQQIFHIASARSDLSQILAEWVSVLGQVFQVDACMIALPDAQVVCWGANQVQYGQSFPLLQALFEEALTGAEWVAIANQTEPSEAIAPFAQQLSQLWHSGVAGKFKLPVTAILGTLTQFQGKVNGLISLMRSRPHPWTEAEVEGLRLISQAIAIVLSQHQLQHQLTQQGQYQQVVNQLSMAIHNASGLHDILNIATEGTARALQVKRGMLLQLKYSDPLFKSRFQEQSSKVRATVVCEWLQESAADFQPSTALNHSFWLSECALCQDALHHSDRLIQASDYSQLPKFEHGAGIAPVFNLEHLPALLLSPLESQGTVLGFLVFQHHQPYVWQPEALELVKLVSAQVSTAIIQTETLRQVQALVEKRTAELQQSLAIQAKLYERTRQQLDQLQRLNQLKDEFLSTVSHELRTPLTSMTMAIRMLRQGGLSSDRSARYLDILEQQCAQETSLINDLLALQELEAKQVPIQLEEINLKDLILNLEQSFNQKWLEKGLTLVLDLPKQTIRLQSDRDSLNRILLELLANAGKYSDPNSPVHLSLSYQAHQSSSPIVLTLTNTGPGVSPEELPFIFDKFRRCQGATQNAIQGTGLGLALVKSLVQLLNATISVSSCSTENVQSCVTSFTLALPRSLDISGSTLC